MPCLAEISIGYTQRFPLGAGTTTRQILKRWRLGLGYFRPDWTPNPHYIKLLRTKNITKTAYICRNWIAWKSSLNWRQWRNDSQKCKCYLTQTEQTKWVKIIPNICISFFQDREKCNKNIVVKVSHRRRKKKEL